MDEIWKQILPSLGAFAPVCVLGWWVISSQNAQLKEERERNDKLTERVFSLGTATAQVLAELKAALKGGGQ